jgi:transcriptional regulator with PAS, ATPase and Fis domain
MIKEGTFREDLYFRINVFSISVPPLRERREDISQLANFFLRNLDVPEKLSVAALQMLIGYAWPGNIRELKNVLEQAIVFSERNTIEPKHLPENIIKQSPESLVNNLNNEVSLDERLIILEKEMIINALRKTGYVQVKAATALGINQRSLWHRIRKHNIDVSSLKNLQ